MSATIQLSNGSYFSFTDAKKRTWRPELIGHALSKICRFTGQIQDETRIYSVAQHCLHASYIVPPEYAFEALMHDRVEYVLGDVSKPLKALLPDYQRLEEFFERETAPMFGLPYPMSSVVKLADTRMLVTERADLMPNPDFDPEGEWDWCKHVKRAPITIVPLSPYLAKLNWLERYRELKGADR